MGTPNDASSSAKNPQTVTYQPGSDPSADGGIRKIGRFVVVAKLGEGAFGEVYRARDPQLDRDVAIKIQKPGSFANNQDRDRFLKEARAAAAVQHPNICPVYDVVLDGDRLTIVMAYIAGTSLAEHLRERKTPFTAKQSALIVRKLAQALQAAHVRGVIHRDLKPGNILFDRDRKDVLITDFGLARIERGSDADVTRDGVILGTPTYMSPEQARGDIKAIGPASDIFSLGVILYELITGMKPFRGKGAEVLGQVLHVPPEPPSKISPTVDQRLEAICLKAMAKNPSDRFASMKEFAMQLGEYLKDSPTGAVKPGTADLKREPSVPSEASQMAEIIAAISTERKAEVQKLEQSQRGLAKLILGVGGCLGLLVLVLSCAAGGAGLWFFGRSGDANASLVSVTLQNITHLHDNTVHYYLDGKKVDSKKLEGPFKISVGVHELVAKRGDEILETRSFRVGPEDDQKDIVPPIAEVEGPVGELIAMKSTWPVWGLAVSADGMWVVSSGFHTHPTGDSGVGVVSLWNSESGEKLHEQDMKFVEAVAFGPKRKLAYFTVRGGSGAPWPFVLEYDLATPKRWSDLRRLDGKAGYFVRQTEISRDGRWVLVGSDHPGNAPPNLTVFNLITGKIHCFVEGSAVSCFAPDSKHVFAGKGNDLVLYDIQGEKPVVLQEFKGHTSPIISIACSPDGKFVAAGTATPASAVRSWNVSSGAMVQHYQSHGSGNVASVQFSPESTRILTAGGDGILRISNVKTGDEIYKTPVQPQITRAVYTPGGTRAIFGCVDGSIKVWQLPK